MGISRFIARRGEVTAYVGTATAECRDNDTATFKIFQYCISDLAYIGSLITSSCESKDPELNSRLRVNDDDGGTAAAASNQPFF